MSKLQHFLPQKLITNLTGKLANCSNPIVKNFLIKKFIKHFKVDLSEAAITDYKEFKTFNDFFTRKLKDNARSICLDNNSIVSPADGFLGQFGKINAGELIQAKGKLYTAETLLANKEQSELFANGSFATIYLAPHNYHRIHMPITGSLESMTYIPGKLFSVNPSVCNTVENVFANNERVVAVFNTEIGKIAIVLVGAIIVGGISTVWHGSITPPHTNEIKTWRYSNSSNQHIKLSKGEEMGLFNVGSTVVMLFEKEEINFDTSLQLEQTLQLGNKIASYL